MEEKNIEILENEYYDTEHILSIFEKHKNDLKNYLNEEETELDEHQEEGYLASIDLIEIIIEKINDKKNNYIDEEIRDYVFSIFDSLMSLSFTFSEEM